MAVENVTDLPGIIGEVGQIALWLQAVGLILVIWIISQLVVFYFNRRRMMEVLEIRKDMKRIESKIDRISKRKKG